MINNFLNYDVELLFLVLKQFNDSDTFNMILSENSFYKLRKLCEAFISPRALYDILYVFMSDTARLSNNFAHFFEFSLTPVSFCVSHIRGRGAIVRANTASARVQAVTLMVKSSDAKPCHSRQPPQPLR